MCFNARYKFCARDKITVIACWGGDFIPSIKTIEKPGLNLVNKPLIRATETIATYFVNTWVFTQEPVISNQLHYQESIKTQKRRKWEEIWKFYIGFTWEEEKLIWMKLDTFQRGVICVIKPATIQYKDSLIVNLNIKATVHQTCTKYTSCNLKIAFQF